MMHEPIHEMIRRTAARRAGHPAIQGRDWEISYQELEERSERLARALAVAGIPSGSLVGLVSSESAHVITGLLAVLRAGCAFVPIDPEHQVARLEAIAEEARLRGWLIEPRHAAHVERLRQEGGFDAPAILLDGSAGADAPAAAPVSLGPDDLSYVYFTSGSTGRPKGIAGRLKAIDHYVRWMHETFDVGEETRFSQLISPAWDGFMLDAFVPLAAGGTVCVPDDRETLLDGARLRAWIDRERVTHIHCTPSLFRLILNQDLAPTDFAALRWALLVGEPLLASDVKRWHAVFGDRIRLVNLYGPTETTLTKLFYLVTPQDGESHVIPIGQPMPGAKAIVVDDNGRICPPGTVGEIYIRTPYRALGYLNQPEATAEVFIVNPFSGRPDDIVYKTGDLGRLREDGNFEFVGRRDGQVKIRGMRIEIAPIEDVLRSHEAVADVAVTPREDIQGNRFLCAYVVPQAGRDLDVARLAEHCRACLADAMVPSAFVVLDSLPRTLTGKVDRKALPDPGKAERKGREHVPPRTPVEERLCTLYSELLGGIQVGIRESFFEIGGHSLLATFLAARIRSSFGIEMPLRQLFETPTVEGLAPLVTRLQAERPRDAREEIVAQPLGTGELPLSFSQQRLWFVDQMEAGSHLYNISAAVRLLGPLRVDLLGRTLDEIVRRHESLRTVFSARDGEPRQIVQPPRPAELPLVDLRGVAGREQAARGLLRDEAHRPFDLAHGPLFRCKLVRLGEQEHALLWVIHHIVADGWSLKVLVQEITALYEAFHRGGASPLRDLPVQYRDFAVWQRQWLEGESLDRLRSYWRRQLAGAPSYLELPADLPRPAVQTFRGGRQTFELPAGTGDALEQICTAEGCTLFMGILASFQILVSLSSGQRDMVVSAPVSGRNRAETEGLIGFFVNTLLFRTDLSGDPTFREVLLRVRRTVLEAYTHQLLPLERVIEEAAPARSLGHSPLLQVGMSFFDEPQAAPEVSGLTVAGFDLEQENVQFELNLVVQRSLHELRGALQYNSSLFTPARIRALVDDYIRIVRRVVQQPDVHLSELIPRDSDAGQVPKQIQGFPLSAEQERLWALHEEAGEGESPDRVVGRILLEGAIDPTGIEEALRASVRRHEILRTGFLRLPLLRLPLQVVRDEADVAFAIRDLSGAAEESRPAEVERLFAAECRAGFDLAGGPALRATLVRLAPDRAVLILALPALCADTGTLEILFQELTGPAAGTPVQYADFSQWHHDFLASDEAAAGRDFWGARLQGMADGDALPFLRSGEAPGLAPRPVPVSLSTECLARTEALAARCGSGLDAVLLAAWWIVLSRLAQHPDVAIGVLHPGRKLAELAGAAGPYAAWLPFSGELAESLTFVETVARVQAQLREMNDWQEAFDGRSSRLPFGFDVSAMPAPRSADGVVLTLEEERAWFNRFDLWLSCRRAPSGLIVNLWFDARRLSRTDAERVGGWIAELLERSLEQPDRPVDALEILSVRDRLLLEGLERTARDLGPVWHLAELFAAQAARTPDRVAVAFQGEELAYANLAARANRLAHRLRREGVGPDVRVALCVDRSLEMIVGLLGILAAGGAYVPVDPSYPQARRSAILEDAAPRIVLTREALLPSLPAVGKARILCLDRDRDEIAAERPEPLAEAGPPESLAYVIYTSGSTGRPKGVMIPHRAIANRLLWMRRAFPLAEDDRVLLKTSFGFDASVWEIFLPLITGARLLVASPDAHRDPAALRSEVAASGATVLQLVPSLLASFLEQAGGSPAGGSLRRLFCGGEALPGVLADRAVERLGVEVCNLYGPTEAAIDATYHPCSPGEAREATVPIGRPLDNVEVHLLDRGGRRVPPGLPGELHIGGAGLARGYLGRPDLTAERFVPGSAAPGARLYRTGDLAAVSPEGEIRFLGRIDHQVKIRGVRIELGEIESVLLLQSGVQEALVVLRGDSGTGPQLVAYVVPREGAGNPDPEDLRAALAAVLPETVVPSAVVCLEELPRLPNGKLDRTALPAPDQVRRRAFVAPRTPAEEILAGIWSETLGAGPVGAHDDFFALGGHSLIAARMIARVRDVFQVDLPVRKLFEAPTVARLAAEVEQALKAAEGLEMPPLERVARDGDLPLSFSQQRLWFLQQLEPESPAYNILGALRLRGALDRRALDLALAAIRRRHEVLRTVFRVVQGEPVQVIQPASAWESPVVDLSGLPEAAQAAEAGAWSARQAARPFDLAAGPLLRTLLLRFGPREHALLLGLHHIVSDGWSVGLMIRELSLGYGAFRRGGAPDLPELPVQYADYAAWQRRWLQGEALERQLAYWRQRLAGAPEVLNLPVDRPHPARPTFRGAVRSRTLPDELCATLQRLSRGASVTLFTTLLTAFKALLQRYGAGDDLVVGTNAANRSHREIEGLIGFFVNALVLRTDLGGGPSFREALGRVRETVLGAFTHQDLPFDRVVEELQPRRDLAVTPLFQVAFDMDPAGDGAPLELAGLELSPMPLASRTAKFDLNLTLTERSGGVSVAAEHSLDVLDGVTIDRLLAHFENLLRSLAATPEGRLDTLPLLGEAEVFHLLHELQGPERPGYPLDRTIQSLFAAQVALTPGEVAAVCDGERLTYAELDRRSQALARRLRHLGAGPGCFVGILEERGFGFLTAMLAIFQAGAAYVPFEPSYPEDRLRYMITNSGIAVLVTSRGLADGRLALLDDCPELRGVVCLSESGEELQDAPWPPGEARDPAYMLYTSGSTGLPKGAVIRHDGAVNHIWAQLEALGLGPELCFLQSAPSSSDISVWQFLAPLVVGGRTVIVDLETVSDPRRLLRVLREERVTIVELVPAVLRDLLDHVAGLPSTERALPDLRWMMATGEAVPVDLVNDWLTLYPGIRAVNAYGPTEASDDVTQALFDRPLPPGTHALSIGRPLANFTCHVVDRDLQLVPLGVPGELCIGGIGVGNGYWRNPEKTSQSFVPDPYARTAGAVLYRTGDLVRWRPGGDLDYLGRIDHQVKIRGFRIELGEIEAALRESPAVRDAVVIVRGEGVGRSLVAYVAGEKGALEAGELRDGLQARLPGHMVPADYVLLPSLPRTPNGKIDRRALPAPDRSRGPRQPLDPPRTPVEQRLAEIWAEVFQVEAVGRDTDFFEIGGHSLLAVRVLSRVQAAFEVEIPLRQIFEHSTVAGLARTVEEARRAVSGRTLPAIRRVARQAQRLPSSQQ